MMRAGDYERDGVSGLLLPRHVRRKGVERAHPQWMAGPGFFGGAPSGNATFDPVTIGTGVSLSAANKRASVTSTGSAQATTGKSSGIWQVEIHVDSDVASPNAAAMIGFCQAGTAMTSYPGAVATSWGYWVRNGNKYNNNVSTAYGAGYGLDSIGIVLNFNTGTATFYKNGVSQGAITHGLTGAIKFMVGIGTGGGGTTVFSIKDTPVYPVAGASIWTD